MLAAATRLLAMTQISVLSPPGGHRLQSVTRSYSVQPSLFHRAFARDQSAFGQRCISSAAASLRLKQYHTCDASSTGRKRRFRVFSLWGNHHRNKSQAQGWPVACHPCRSLFSSSRQKEEEEDRSAAQDINSSLLDFINPAWWIHTNLQMHCMQESHGVLSKSWWQCNSTTAPPFRKGDKGFCKRTAYCERW